MTAHATAQGTHKKPQHPHVAQAASAVRCRDWGAAARHFIRTAAALPPDPHGSVTAAELILRRQAHVAASMHKRMQYFGLELAFVVPEGDRYGLSYSNSANSPNSATLHQDLSPLPSQTKGHASTTDQKPIRTSKKGEIGEFRAISLKFFRAFGRKLPGKGVDMTRQKKKAHGTNRKSHCVNAATAKRGFYKWTSKIKRRLKRRCGDWIAIAALVWEMASTMLPYIF